MDSTAQKADQLISLPHDLIGRNSAAWDLF